MAEKTIVNIRSNGDGIALGKKATLDGIVESAWPIACPDIALSNGLSNVQTDAGTYGSDVSGLRVTCLNAYGFANIAGKIVTGAIPATSGDYVLAELTDPAYAPAEETILSGWPASPDWYLVITDAGEISLRNKTGNAIPSFTVALTGTWLCVR